MAFINYSSREINVKLVYYGPGLGGKTTNLRYIFQKTAPDTRGRMIELATETERTLFFDFLPLAMGRLGGFSVRFHLYTVPGQVFYDASRKIILKDVDGIVFVADSQIERMDANLESLDNMKVHLSEYSIKIEDVPWVIQYNKRDLPSAVDSSELSAMLNPLGVPEFNAIATRGEGVFETLKSVAKVVLKELRKQYTAGSNQ